MDPNANLTAQRKCTIALLESNHLSEPEKIGIGEELATLVDALDQWISKGGFLPTEWSR